MTFTSAVGGGSTMVIGSAAPGTNSGGLFGTNVLGNFHIDSDKLAGGGGNDGHIYLDYFNGKGVIFGNGNTGTSGASVDTAGVVTATAFKTVNGLSYYKQTCDINFPATISCDAACTNPGPGCTDVVSKGTCVGAKAGVNGGTQSAAACASVFAPAGSTTNLSCWCSKF